MDSNNDGDIYHPSLLKVFYKSPLTAMILVKILSIFALPSASKFVLTQLPKQTF
jgi:hypothetical protein